MRKQIKDFSTFPNIKWYLLAVAGLLLLSLSLESYYNHLGYGEKDSQRFNRILNQKEKKLQEGMLLIKEYYHQSDDSTQFFSIMQDEFFSSFQSEGLAYFLYTDENLNFWSENIIPVPENCNDLPAKKLVQYGNSYYLSKTINNGNICIYGLIHIKSEHPYANKKLKNGFRNEFRFSDDVEIIPQESEKYNIYNLNGEYILSLDFQKSFKENFLLKRIILLLYTCAFFLFLILLRRITHYSPKDSKNIFVLTTSLLSVLLLLILSHFQFPRILFQLDIFTLITIQSPIFSPAIGSLLAGVIITFFIVYTLYIDFSISPEKISRPIQKTFLILGFTLISAFLYLVNFLVLKFLVLNTNISFETFKVLDLSFYTFLSFLILAVLFATFALWTDKLLGFFEYTGDKKSAVKFIGLIAIFILFFYFLPGNLAINPESGIFYILILAALYYFRFVSKVQYRLSSFVVFVFLFAIFSLIEITFYSNEKNSSEMKMMAVDLSTEHDPVAELLFVDLERSLQEDTEIQDLIYNENFDFEQLYNTVQRKYFRGFWDKYDLQITVCAQHDSVFVSPPVKQWYPCYPFFYESILSEGITVPNTNVYFLDNLNGRISYFMAMVYNQEPDDEVTMFLELDSRLVLEGLGYPSLLLDESLQPEEKEYSYAKYNQKQLITSIGEFDYSTRSDVYSEAGIGFEEFKYDNYDHLAYHLDSENTIIVSKPSLFWVDILISFSYIFSFYFLALLVLLIFSRISPIRFSLRPNFKTRIQLAMNSILFFSFLLIGAGTVYFSIRQYKTKQFEILEEKVQSVYIELIHKLEFESDLEGWSSSSYFNLNELLQKFSNVFYSDINLYDADGRLLASSRPEIFEMGLLSLRMDAHAFKEMNVKMRSEFVQEEAIGNLKFLSAYVPFVNANNQLLAYLNLPYFTRQDALTREITNLVVAIINIVVLLSLLGFTIAVFMANTITQPLNLVQQHIARIRLGEQNEIIDYKHSDEIGNLVKEYNLMVEQLQNSAELLAKSERDAAWREMAKQIAHEIKNPLTPMKLSIQHLQRTLSENPERVEEMVKKLSETLIEQIDNLSSIATEFSSFAKMPQAKNEIVDLEQKLKKSIELFTDYERCILSLKVETKEKIQVFADKEQISRVFINLIKNAIQAIPENEKGQIEVRLSRNDKMALISIRDNGKGIPSDVRGKLFQPNFTTKTSGMGLGLAIVRNIIHNAGGEIYFETELEKGSTFFVELPLVKAEQS